MIAFECHLSSCARSFEEFCALKAVPESNDIDASFLGMDQLFNINADLSSQKVSVWLRGLAIRDSGPLRIYRL